MNAVKRLMLVASGIIMLGITLAPRSAAATVETCTVTSVWYAPARTSPIGASVDILSVGCSDGTYYYLAVGTPVTNGCTGSIDALKAMESIALSARTSGKTVSIPWYTATCPGLGSVKVLSEIGM